MPIPKTILFTAYKRNSDREFMAQWAGDIMTEYPNFSIVGEEWSYNPLLIAYWQNGNLNKDGYNSNLRSTMDFSMQNIISNITLLWKDNIKLTSKGATLLTAVQQNNYF